MTAITGNTYPVKDQLKALGARWDADKKAWMVPDQKADEARQIVAGRKHDAPTQAGIPGRATEKQIITLRKMLRRVSSVRQFDSFSGDGDHLAGEIREKIDALGGMDRLSSRQASDFIGTLMAAVDDEM